MGSSCVDGVARRYQPDVQQQVRDRAIGGRCIQPHPWQTQEVIWLCHENQNCCKGFDDPNNLRCHSDCKLQIGYQYNQLDLLFAQFDQFRPVHKKHKWRKKSEEIVKIDKIFEILFSHYPDDEHDVRCFDRRKWKQGPLFYRLEIQRRNAHAVQIFRRYWFED